MLTTTNLAECGKATKKAVIWISVLLFALVGAAAAGVCFFLHMGTPIPASTAPYLSDLTV